MASSSNQKYTDAAQNYDAAQSKYTGQKGYQLGVEAAKNEGIDFADTQQGLGRIQGAATAALATQNGQNQGLSNTNAANANAANQSVNQNSLVNSEAKKYAAQQAQAAAAGAQSQATTAARAAGMNKAQAAMMGSQQNANAFQNSYGNAYSQQMGQANNAYENQANRANSNINNSANMALGSMNNATNVYGQNMANQQNAMDSMSAAKLGAKGTAMGAGQQEGQNEYNRKWGNWSAGLGLLSSDEKLKHYQECSKKVIIKSPNAIKKLKYIKEN